MSPSDSSDHSITRRDFMKKTALTAGAVMILSRGIGLANPSSSTYPTMDSTWTEYEYTNATPITIVGTGATEDAARDDFDQKCDAANINNAGKSTQVDEAPKVDISLMTRVYKVTNHANARPNAVPATPPATGFTVTGTFHKDDPFANPPVPKTKFRIIKWE